MSALHSVAVAAAGEPWRAFAAARIRGGGVGGRVNAMVAIGVFSPLAMLWRGRASPAASGVGVVLERPFQRPVGHPGAGRVVVEPRCWGWTGCSQSGAVRCGQGHVVGSAVWAGSAVGRWCRGCGVFRCQGAGCLCAAVGQQSQRLPVSALHPSSTTAMTPSAERVP